MFRRPRAISFAVAPLFLALAAPSAAAQMLSFGLAHQTQYAVTGGLPADAWPLFDGGTLAQYAGSSQTGGAVEFVLPPDEAGLPYEITRVGFAEAVLPAGTVLSLRVGGAWVAVHSGAVNGFLNVFPRQGTHATAGRLEIPAGAFFRVGELLVDAPQGPHHLFHVRYDWYGQAPSGTTHESISTLLQLERTDDLVIYYATATFPLAAQPLQLPGWHGALQLKPDALIHLGSFPTPGLSLWAFAIFFSRDPSLLGLDFKLQALVLDILPSGQAEFHWTRTLTYIV